MSKRLLPPDWHVTKGNGDPATDATLSFRVAGSSTPTPIWYDKDLTQPTLAGTSGISCDAYGYPAAGGNDIAVWGADDVSYDCIVAATGYNGSAPKTLEDIGVADTTTTDETTSELVLGNAFDNGGFDVWTGGTSFSNLSGDGDGDETADGWFLTQPASAANAVSQQAGFLVGSDAISQRYSARVGRPQSSSNVNEIRFWKTVKPEIAWRLRGKSVTLRYTLVAGADFSASGLSVTLATGTTENEDGDLIDSGGFAGHVNVVSQARSITTTSVRYEDTVTLGDTIKEIGVQFSYVPVGTAGANDWFQVQDVDLKIASAGEEFAARPEALEFFVSKLGQGGRYFVAATFSDPNADRLTFWDDSAGAISLLSLDTGLSITGTTLSLHAQLVTLLGLTPTDNGVIIGNGSAFVVETGATFRTSVGLGTGDSPQFTGLALTGVLGTSAGSAGAPSIAFSGDTDTGLWSRGTNQIGFAAGGADIGFVYAGGIALNTGQFLAANGTVGAPSVGFINDQDCGDYRIGANNIGRAMGGALVAQWDTSGSKDSSGNLHLTGGKRAVPIVASAMTSPPTNGAAGGVYEPGNGMAIPVKDFDAGTEEYACFIIPMPKSWNEGTLTARFRWTGAGSGNVVWGIAGVAVSDDDTLNASLGTAQEVTDAQGTAGDQMTTAETSAITIAGSPAEGDLVCFRVYRKAADAADTLTGDCRLIAVDLFPSFSGANDA